MFDCIKSKLVELKNNNESDRIEIFKTPVKEMSLSSYDDEHYSVDHDDSDNCKYNKQNCPLLFISKYSLGQIFYLYVIPIIGGIALIMAGAFLLKFYFLKKQKNCVNQNKKEEKAVNENVDPVQSYQQSIFNQMMRLRKH